MLSFHLRDVCPSTIHTILHLLHAKEVSNHEITAIEDHNKAQISDSLGLFPAPLLLFKSGRSRLLPTLPRLLHALDLHYRNSRVHT